MTKFPKIPSRWLTGTMSVIALIGMGTFWVAPLGQVAQPVGQAEQATPPPEDEPRLEPLTHARMIELRQDLGLLSEDLAAMGLQQQQAAGVLASLLSWYRQNERDVEQARQDVRQAKQQLRDLLRQMNIGPHDPGVVAQYHQQVRDHQQAIERRQQLIESAMPQISGLLDFDQRQQWETIRDNKDLAPPYRYASGLDEQNKQQLLASLQKHGPRSQAHQEVEQQVLGYQHVVLGVTLSRQRSQMPAVLAAERAILGER